MLQRISDHFETFTKSVHEGSEDPCAPGNPQGEPWWPIEEQREEMKCYKKNCAALIYVTSSTYLIFFLF